MAVGAVKPNLATRRVTVITGCFCRTSWSLIAEVPLRPRRWRRARSCWKTWSRRLDAVVAEQQRDEESTGAAVAIEEGVDGLELRVGEAGADEGGHVVVVEKEFERTHASEDLIGRGRHQGSALLSD